MGGRDHWLEGCSVKPHEVHAIGRNQAVGTLIVERYLQHIRRQIHPPQAFPRSAPWRDIPVIWRKALVDSCFRQLYEMKRAGSIDTATRYGIVRIARATFMLWPSHEYFVQTLLEAGEGPGRLGRTQTGCAEPVVPEGCFRVHSP